MEVAFTFDDGRKDALVAADIMNKYNIHGTFFVTTGFVDGTFKTNAFGEGRNNLEVDDLKKIINQGMEISSHGDKHIMEEKDFIISFNKLREWGINKTKKIGFSIPNSKYTDDELNNFFEKNKDKIQYIRAGRSPSCYSFSMKLSYLIYKFFKIQYFFNLFNTYNINKQTKTRQLYSVVITKNINPKHISNFINKHASNDGLIVLMFHSIVEHPKDKWEYSKKRFTILCEEINHMINSNVIKCLKIEDLY